MSASAWPLRVFVLACPFLFTLGSVRAQGVDRKEIIRQARQSYYSLKDSGMQEFRCAVKPDWDAMSRTNKADAVAGDEAMSIMRQVRFQIVVGPSGSSTVSHQSDQAPPNEPVAERVRKKIASIELLLTSFFQVWSGFAITPPFPVVDSEYQLDDLGEKFRLSYHQDHSNIEVSMMHDFAIDEVNITGPGVDVTIRPHLSRSKPRFVFAGYDGIYKSGSSIGQYTVEVENQSVDGLDLPATMVTSTSLPNSPGKIVLTFTDCRVVKR